MNRFICILAIAILTPFLHSEEQPDFLQEPTLFISLGSQCQPALLFEFCNVRNIAFPFDWIVSYDKEALIQILEEDFEHFLQNDHLTILQENGHLLNVYHHLEFPHDGDFRKPSNMETFKSKYQRRIKRFQQLEEYTGHVFFLRAADAHTEKPPYYYNHIDAFEHTEEYALRLNAALHKRFPHLHYHLIFINLHNRNFLELEKEVGENILFLRANPQLSKEEKIINYQPFFSLLKQYESGSLFHASQGL